MPLADGIKGGDFYVPLTQAALAALGVFICEEPRAVRRVMSGVVGLRPLEDRTFLALPWPSLSTDSDWAEMVATCRSLWKKGGHVGLFSASGVPIIADPGAHLVAQAQRDGIHVAVHQVPSAPLAVLAGSGFMGQSFHFHGYLPKDRKQCERILRGVFQQAQRTTQVFIETPYRNQPLLMDILTYCPKDLQLCLGVSLGVALGTEQGYLRTKTISDWRKDMPALHKKEVTFAIGKWAT